MPLDFYLLQKFGTTDERLKEVFTASTGKLPREASEKEKKEVELDMKMRQKMEDLIASRIDEAILLNLKSSHLHGAVDLAWDSSTITRRTIPLVMYAQRRISQEECMRKLEDLACKDQYVTHNPETKKFSLDLPKLTEVNVNLVRSIITRRTAAQSARYTNLYPFFKYESRGTSEADKLRGDLMSQRMDIMADQFGYRALQIQAIRDMLLYPHVIAFPACRWEREVEWFDKDEFTAEEYRSGEAQPAERTKREGVPWILPHASRTFYDLAYPPTSINTDSGCEWFGFWDVVRYRDIADNLDYFNRTEVGYSAESVTWFHQYSSYFSQYYTTISPPLSADEISGDNDRKAQLGRYTSATGDSSAFICHLYWKVKPNQWRIGDYPHFVWLHLVVANSRTVVYAEIMPDCPGAVFSYNESAQRMTNLSMAHDILPFQDQLTNLYNQLLECARRDLFSVFMLNLDAFPTDIPEAKEALENFRKAMRGGNFYTAMSILEVSLIKMRDLGVDLDNVFKVVRQPPNTQLGEILQAITQTIMLTERVMALSPQEQAQLSPRETSATEVQVIAGTTENIYQFISDAIDEGRSAMKRYIYNAYVALADEEIYLPVASRYRPIAVEKAGFQVDVPENSDPAFPQQFTLRGTKKKLIADYIFSTRDGADRASNIQSAQVLTQMLGILLQEPILAHLTKEKLVDLINAIIRQSGAGVDVLLDVNPSEANDPIVPPQPQLPAGAAPAQAGASGEQLAQVELPKQ